MKSLKKIFALILCLTMLFTLGACGKDKDKENSDGAGLFEFEDEKGEGLTASTEQETQSQVTSNTGSTASKVEFDSKDPFANIPSRLKGTTVTFACWGDEGNEAYQPMIKAFTKKTGIKVKIQTVEQKTYMSTIQQKIVAGKGPDIIIDVGALATAFAILQPIDKYVDINDSFWNKETIANTTVNGRVYEVNSKKSTWNDYEFIIYNKDLFTKNNIKSPGDYYKAGQWTWENAYECMSKMSAIDGLYGGWISPNAVSTSFGTPICSYDNQAKKFNNNIMSEGVQKAYQWNIRLLDEGIWDSSMWFAQFNNGNVGLFNGGTYYSKFNGEFKNIDGSLLDAVPMPTSYQGQKTYQLANHRGYGIAKNAQNPEGAAYFLRWFLDYQNYKDAGVTVFKSKTLENFYFNTMIPLTEKEQVVYTFYGAPCKILGVDSNTFISIGKGQSNNVATKLKTYEGQLQSAIDELNRLVAAVK